jgi:hypothetical protein
MSKVNHLALNGRRLRRIESALDKLIRSAREAHRHAKIHYNGANMDGSRIRNLDDLAMHLEHARTEIREYMSPIN